ncbi:MAG: NADP-dependent malic enzyme [bacterium]
MDYNKLSLEAHKKYNGKLSINSKMPLKNKDDLSIAYTPGVAAVCLEIKKDTKKARELTSSKKTVAVVTDGSAVLGLGNIGHDAAIPVMEGKAALFKKFGGVDAYPIVLATQNADDIIKAVKIIAPSFGGINLEDISAPRCFEIEKKLQEELDIPVFHDDQHGTAIVVLAGLINALKVVHKKKEQIKIAILGAGAAGTAIAKLICRYGVKNIIMSDSKGIISKYRNDLNESKKELSSFTNKDNISGGISDAIRGADVFIGVSAANVIKSEHIKSMNKDAIVFAMANPAPEIMPDEAKKAGARIVATGRSDFPNQLNNVLVFPGIFKGAIAGNIKKITEEMKIKAAIGLANTVKRVSGEKIIPSPFDKKVAIAVAKAVKVSK